MSITYIPPRVPSVEGFLKEDGTVPLTGVWDTGNVLIKGPSAIYTSATEPTSPYVGMLWNDTSYGSRQMIKKRTANGWNVVASFEQYSRTMNLVHDHGSLLTKAILDAMWNEIGKLGAIVTMIIEIENKTHKTFDSGSAVDAGGGLVKLPIASGHGFVAGERVCIDGTVNYDGVFVINSVEETFIIIPATYVAETIPADAVVRVVIEGGWSMITMFNKVVLRAKGYATGRSQKQSVVFYHTGSAFTQTSFYVTGIYQALQIQGIKSVGTGAHPFTFESCPCVTVESCAGVGTSTMSGIVSTNGSFVYAKNCSFKDGYAGIYAIVDGTVLSYNCETVSGIRYGLCADYGGTIKKASATQPTGSIANEYAVTSRGGQII